MQEQTTTPPESSTRPTGRPFPWPRLAYSALACAGAWVILLGWRFLAQSTGLVLAGSGSWSTSWAATTPTSVASLIAGALPSTLFLLFLVIALALVLASIGTLMAAWVHRLEERSGPLGSVLKALGRLVIFSNAALPAFALLALFGAVYALTTGDHLGLSVMTITNALKLVFAVIALSYLPATLALQSVAPGVASLGRGEDSWPRLLGRLLASILRQTGGILSAIVLIEVIVPRAGVGRLLVRTMVSMDWPVLLGALAAMSVLVLAGRLLSLILAWVAASPQSAAISPGSAPWRRRARLIWLSLSLALLLLPIGVGLYSLGGDQEAARQLNVNRLNEAPSSEHPWGTDYMGRDLQQILRSGLRSTLQTAGLAALFAWLPSVFLGALAGFLLSLRQPVGRLIAAVVLLPTEAQLFLPAVGLGIALALFSWTADPALGGIWIGLAVGSVLQPRLARLYLALWRATPAQHKVRDRILIGPALALLGALFAAIGVTVALELLGAMPNANMVQPSLGLALRNTVGVLRVQPANVLLVVQVLALCTVPTFIAAEALQTFFQHRGALARLNE